jgi:hypothetical protein
MNKDMSIVYETFIRRKPKCFKSFELENSVGIESDWVSSPEFLSKFVKCSCGNKELNIYSSSNGELFLAPVLLECPKCNIKEEIFTPEKHGWNGEHGDNDSIIGDADPVLRNSAPTRIVAEYSYQGEENYEDLIEDGIMNPENYFDMFAIYTVTENGQLNKIVSYECA